MVYTLSELLADPDVQERGKTPVVPFVAWAERVSMMAAREKLGKSCFAGAAAAAVSAGDDFLGCRVTQRPVLWVGLEEHAGEIVHRLTRFGADPQWTFVVNSLATALDDLEEAVVQVSSASAQPPLVVIDTLGALVGGEVEDAGSSTQWTPIMQRLTRIAREDGAAVLILHHARKSDGKYRDSTAIGANVDMILELRSPSERSTTRTVSGKGRWTHHDFSVDLQGNRFVLIAGGKPLEDWVFEFVAENPGCSSRDVRDGVVGANAKIDEAVKALTKEGRLINRGSDSAFALHAVARARSQNP